MQYGVPTFLNAHGEAVIYLLASKKNHVNFGFLQSAKLFDPKGLLEGSGTPSKHIKLKPDVVLDETALRAFVDQCAAIEA